MLGAALETQSPGTPHKMLSAEAQLRLLGVPGDFCIQDGGEGDPGRVGNESVGGGAVDFASGIHVRNDHTFVGDHVDESVERCLDDGKKFFRGEAGLPQMPVPRNRDSRCD